MSLYKMPIKSQLLSTLYPLSLCLLVLNVVDPSKISMAFSHVSPETPACCRHIADSSVSRAVMDSIIYCSGLDCNEILYTAIRVIRVCWLDLLQPHPFSFASNELRSRATCFACGLPGFRIPYLHKVLFFTRFLDLVLYLYYSLVKLQQVVRS